MTETMIERMAKAMTATLCHHSVVMHPNDIKGLAYDAIAAMREPTEAMAKAFEYAKYHARPDDRRDPFVRAYGAMIDAALAEEG